MASSVLFLSGDLMFASRVRAAAERSGHDFRLAGDLPDEADVDVCLVVLDLSTRSALTEGLVERCDQVCPDAKLIAYGPHVQVDRLKAARQAGIETVLTRGQFDAGLASLFVN